MFTREKIGVIMINFMITLRLLLNLNSYFISDNVTLNTVFLNVNIHMTMYKH